jgi:hypothetical protein
LAHCIHSSLGARERKSLTTEAKVLANRTCPDIAGDVPEAIGMAKDMVVVADLPQSRATGFLEGECSAELEDPDEFE